jgi:hypothetical protein
MLAITRILAINDDPEISESGRYRRLIELLLEACTFSLFFSADDESNSNHVHS